MSSIFGTFALPTPEAEKVQLYSLTKTALTVTDDTLLATVTDPVQGDIAVIDTVIDGENFNKSAYMFNGTQWVALNGNVDADKVILTADITMAGNYTQVGNLTKTQTGTATFATKGMSVADALTEIFSKRLQPTITANPSLGNVTISKTGVIEAGTQLNDVIVSAVTFNSGSYTYGPETGVTATSWKTERVTNVGTTELTGAGVGGAVTDAGPLTVGDQTGDYSSIMYRVTAEYGDGVVANDNLGSESNPQVKIAAGSVSKDSSKITSFRKYFFGATVDRPEAITSDWIRNNLTHSTGACSNGKKFSINIPDGATTVVIAYPATFRDLTSVIDTGAMNSPLTEIFAANLETMLVKGANDYAGISYKVYAYKPKTALGSNTYDVTI